MDADLEGVEIVFAQKLASGEPTTRKRALKTLQDWINQQSVSKPFNEEDMFRLVKGLHYVLWMQDKMLMQEELADRISSLLSYFNSEEEKVLYVKCMLIGLSREWYAIDRWRMDKFLMMMRRLIRVLFGHLASLKWNKDVRVKYWKAFKESAISADSSFADGLKFHFASLFLDELDLAGGLTKKQVTICLKPFAEVLGDRKISDYLFNSFLEEIYGTILHSFSEEVAPVEDDTADDVLQTKENGLKFDYAALANQLFEVGKRPETISPRRSILYDYVDKLKTAAMGKDPMPFEEPKPAEELTMKDFENAQKKILEMGKQLKQERDLYKQARKKARQAASVNKEAEILASKSVSDESDELHKVVQGNIKKKKVKKAGKRPEKRRNRPVKKAGKK